MREREGRGGHGGRAGEESHEHVSDELLAARAYLSTDERRQLPAVSTAAMSSLTAVVP